MTLPAAASEIVTYDPRADGHTFETYQALFEQDHEAAWELHSGLMERVFGKRLADGRSVREHLDDLIGNSGGALIINGRVHSVYSLSKEPTTDEVDAIAQPLNAIPFSYGRVRMEYANFLDDRGEFLR